MAGDRAPIVLLHGFWHGTWCWAGVIEDLAARSRVCAAVEMAGHGLHAQHPASAARTSPRHDEFATEPSPVGHVTLDAAADLLVAQLRRIGQGRPCVLVAHSMGGTVATAAIQRAPELIAHAVYVCAFMPGSGTPAAAYINSAENAGELVGPHLRADPTAIGALRLDPRSADVTYTAGIRECFYNDVEPGPAAAAMALLMTDAPLGIAGGTTILDAKAWGTVPRTSVYCARDNAIRPPLQRRMIAEADLAFPRNPTTVVELDASHSPFLSRPGELADIIHSYG